MSTGKWHLDRAENRLLAKTQIHVDLASGTYPIMDVPRYAMIHEAKVELVSAYGTTSTLTLGWQGNGVAAVPAGFLSSAEIDPDGAILMVSSINGAAANAQGKYFNAQPGSILLVVAKGNAAITASVRVWIDYSVIH